MDGEIGRYAPGGELEHIGLKETGRTAKTETRGAMLVLTREMIINDDLGAFADLFRLFGRKVNLTRQKAWFKVLLDNLDELDFVASNVGFSFDGFKQLSNLFSTKTDASGDFISLGGKILLVPPALEPEAAILQKSSTLQFLPDNVISVSNQEKLMIGNINPFFNAFKTVSSPFFSSVSPIAGGSDKHYMLFASPAVCPVMGNVWLKGVKTPFCETAETSFNTLGIAYRCYFDYKPFWLGKEGAVYCSGLAEA